MIDVSPPKWLSKAEIFYIHKTAITRYGDSFSIRDEGSLESALAVQKIIMHMVKLICAYWLRLMLKVSPVTILSSTATWAPPIPPLASFFTSMNTLFSITSVAEQIALIENVAAGQVSRDELAAFYRQHTEPR